MKKGSTRVYDVEIAKVLGIKEAVILQQIQYWEQKAKGREIDGVKWIYMTYEQLNEQFPHWCLRTIKNIVGSLRKKGVIITKKEHELIKGSNGQTLHYKSAKNALIECKDYTDPVHDLHPKSAKDALAYKYKYNTDKTKENIQIPPDVFSGGKGGKQTLPRKQVKPKESVSPIFEKDKPRYPDGELGQLGRIAEAWLEKKDDHFKDFVEDYLEREMKHRPIGNNDGYKRTILVEIWKKQTEQPNETSFKYKPPVEDEREPQNLF